MKAYMILRTHSGRKWLRSSVLFKSTIPANRNHVRSRRARPGDGTGAPEAIALARLTALTQLALIKSGRVI